MRNPQPGGLGCLLVWTLPFDLTGMGGPAGSSTTTGIALRVTGLHKPHHHDKVKTPLGDISKIYDNESSKSNMCGLNGSSKNGMYGLNENDDNFSNKNDGTNETGRSIEGGNGWCDYTQRRLFFTFAYIIMTIEILISREIIRKLNIFFKHFL
jgi:hypothetical protein